jgi:hypothetical protein
VLVLTVAGLPLGAMAHQLTSVGVSQVVLIFLFLAVGVVVAWHQPRNPIGRILLVPAGSRPRLGMAQRPALSPASAAGRNRAVGDAGQLYRVQRVGPLPRRRRDHVTLADVPDRPESVAPEQGGHLAGAQA